MRRRAPEGGFTLIELLVAIGITVILLTLLYETFGATIRSTEIVEEETDTFRMAQIGLSVMADEIRSAYWSKTQTNTSFTGTKDTLRFTSLSRFRDGEGVEGSDMAAVHYYLETRSGEPGEPLQVSLIHEEETNSLSLASGSLQRSELAEKVDKFELRYFGKRAWVDTWEASSQESVPEAVEIQLSFRGRDGKVYPFRTRVAIPVASEKAG